MFFPSIFCGSLFCGSAVHILDDVTADSEMLSADQGDLTRTTPHTQSLPPKSKQRVQHPSG